MGKGYDTGANKVIVVVDPTEKKLNSFRGTLASLTTQIETAHSELSSHERALEVIKATCVDFEIRRKGLQQQFIIVNNDLCNRKTALGRQIDDLTNIIREKQAATDKFKTDYTEEEENIKQLLQQSENMANVNEAGVAKIEQTLNKLTEERKTAEAAIEKLKLKKKDVIEHKGRFEKEMLEKQQLLEEGTKRYEKLKEETEKASGLLNEKLSKLISEEARLDQKKIDIADLQKREKAVEENTVAQKVIQEQLDDQKELQKVKHLHLLKRESKIKSSEKLIRETFKN